jgi:hypothetical protein
MPKIPDVLDRWRMHIEASRERDEWAKKAIDLLARGKQKEGMAASDKAHFWEAKAKSLES